MKPRILHQQAMDLSFKAKEALDENNFDLAFELYKQAANFESEVADFYLDKPELEPTRSIIIRSAAYMNLKAGLIDEAKKFIFYGLLHIQDDGIKNQLNEALEFTISLKNLNPEAASREYLYLNLLRKKSISYIIEPVNSKFGHSVTLQMVSDFSEDYLKSLKAFAKAKLRDIYDQLDDISRSWEKELDKVVNPLIANASYGSFQFSIANDFLLQNDEPIELFELKKTVIPKYHSEIFINPLSDKDIARIKNDYSDDEVNEIFRPLAKIKSNNSPYKVGYYDTENLKKVFVDKIVNKQRKKLLPVRQISQEDIGELENSIIHKTSLDGKVKKHTILKEELKFYKFDKRINIIEPAGFSPLMFSEEIILDVLFTSEHGFRFTFEDLRIENTDIQYQRGLVEFYNKFYQRLVELANTFEKNEQEQFEWEIVKKLINNPNSLILKG
jgi:hypothetical protein